MDKKSPSRPVPQSPSLPITLLPCPRCNNGTDEIMDHVSLENGSVIVMCHECLMQGPTGTTGCSGTIEDAEKFAFESWNELPRKDNAVQAFTNAIEKIDGILFKLEELPDNGEFECDGSMSSYKSCRTHMQKLSDQVNSITHEFKRNTGQSTKFKNYEQELGDKDKEIKKLQDEIDQFLVNQNEEDALKEQEG